jgi:asparaginyl-tRNA synthetase
MSYRDGIKYLNEHGIKRKDDETGEMVDHVVGDDIAEAAERQMTDQLGVPLFLHGFPKHLKAFYMKKIPGDEEFTESCDLLIPNVGEVVGQCQSSSPANASVLCVVITWMFLIGGSMRITDVEELLEGYKRDGIDPAAYYWYVLITFNWIILKSRSLLGSRTSESMAVASTEGTGLVLR